MNKARTGFILIAGTLLAAASPAFPQAQANLQDESFSYSADILDSSLRSDTLELSGNVRVAQGAMSIEAERATADDFRSENSRWQFEDSVHVRTADAELLSQIASAAFQRNQLVKAEVEGSPAEFEQRRGSPDRLVRGRACNIEYDVTNNLVTLTGDVWFSYGKDEFRGDTVIYDMKDERVRVNPGGDSSGRVKGIIRPRARNGGTNVSPSAQNEDGSGLQRDQDRDVANESGA